jgi:putative transcriptional regulator
MPIIVRLDRVLVERKMSQKVLSDKIGLDPMNLSRIKTGKIRAIRFSTLEKLCEELNCQPGDILEFMSKEQAKEHGFI